MGVASTYIPPPSPAPLALSGCKDIAEGAVFIIASGASAKDFPLNEFKHVPMIVVNGAISMFLNTSISPFFYVCTDSGFFTQQSRLFHAGLALSQRVVLREDYVLHDIPLPSGEFYALKKAAKSTWRDLFSAEPGNLIRRSKFHTGRNSSIGFSKDLSEGYFDARTVAYLALQVAYHAGFNKVFMVGVDLCPDTGRFYETAQSNKSPCVLDEHMESRILPSFELMAEKVIDADFSVYNLSSTSKLPSSLIPYKSIDEVRTLLPHSRQKNN